MKTDCRGSAVGTITCARKNILYGGGVYDKNLTLSTVLEYNYKVSDEYTLFTKCKIENSLLLGPPL
jgi:hypothetical protein